MKRLASLLVTLMLVVGIGVAAVLSSEERDAPDVSLSPGAPGQSGLAAPTPVPATTVATIEPVAFGEPNSPAPSTPGQSRLWFHDGEWWGVYPTAALGEQRIFRLDAGALAWTDTGVAVDDRAFARMDVVSDGDRLVIASAGPQPEPRHALRIARFSYDPAARVYQRDANFPIPITEVGVESLTAARSDDGRLWVAYRQGALMAIDHSLDSELAWRGPFVPTVAGGAIEEVAVASLGDRVAIVWTRPSDDLVSMAWHDIGGPADVWQASPDAVVAGLRLGEDQLSVAADRSPGAERLFVAVRTSTDESPDRGRLDPQVVLVEFAAGATPTSYLFGRVDEQHAGPIILINSDDRELHVVAASPEVGGAIYYKTTSLDRIAFPPGRGTSLIPASDDHPRLANPSSTKQALDDATGMLVAASDTGAGVYGFGALGVAPGSAEESPAPVPSSAAVAPLVDNTFDGLAVGADVPGWVVDGDPLPSFVIRVLAGSDSSARLSATTVAARACTTFRDISEGTVRVEAAGLFNVASEQELRLIQVRGAGGELASIRLRNGEVVYGDGIERIRSELVLVPGRWYRSVLTLDLATKTYAIELYDAANDSLLLQDDGLAWRTDSPVVNRVCAELPPQPGLDLYLDDVRVTTTTGEGT
jgi:hypothetical protein